MKFHRLLSRRLHGCTSLAYNCSSRGRLSMFQMLRTHRCAHTLHATDRAEVLLPVQHHQAQDPRVDSLIFLCLYFYHLLVICILFYRSKSIQTISEASPLCTDCIRGPMLNFVKRALKPRCAIGHAANGPTRHGCSADAPRASGSAATSAPP